MSVNAFVDTNVLVYLLGQDSRKAEIAKARLAEGATVSVQVLNEFANVARRKMALSWDELDDVLSVLRSVCEIVPITVETHERGVALARRHQLSVYDAMIVAAARLAGCANLWSEDMQDGATLDGVTILDPFKG
ncbi:putative nucleic acid-binding protein [Methylopila capsulata]|uniref:Ribonuclease VapC n=1 Tax=Methylopila capsulata TaxID=61654 RepID=A0A9W6MRE5_9HYPH|nr:PIN domain-containing protein [Methylopila capsulata]MBM7850337.1 putative nucleic acid-binding protein [Methylopila capsulata]GLK55630.1 ribonuclease VapC [Methylopila capsulata]